MARHNAVEIITGACVILAAGGFLAFAVGHTGARIGKGYELTARFDRVDGLHDGAEVRIAGVQVGSVESITLDPQTYQAVVRFTVAPNVQLSTDSSASVASDGLLGGKFLALETGGESEMLKQGGQMTITQGSVNLEGLIGKYLFGTTSKAPAGNGASAGASTAPADAGKASLGTPK